jgi:hypothetical protein
MQHQYIASDFPTKTEALGKRAERPFAFIVRNLVIDHRGLTASPPIGPNPGNMTWENCRRASAKDLVSRSSSGLRLAPTRG